jgi:hypothetical protein
MNSSIKNKEYFISNDNKPVKNLSLSISTDTNSNINLNQKFMKNSKNFISKESFFSNSLNHSKNNISFNQKNNHSFVSQNSYDNPILT